jgi:glutaconate CoA-transferase subunit B
MNWTPFSFIVIHLARQIRAGEITFSGVNSTLPMLACLLAKRAYEFDYTYINVAGGVRRRRPQESIGDVGLCHVG